MTTKQAADLIGYSRHGAWEMLCDISTYMPIVQDTKSGRAGESLWYLDFDGMGSASIAR